MSTYAEERKTRTASTERLEDLRVDIAGADTRPASARSRGHDAPWASSAAGIRGRGYAGARLRVGQWGQVGWATGGSGVWVGWC